MIMIIMIMIMMIIMIIVIVINSQTLLKIKLLKLLEISFKLSSYIIGGIKAVLFYFLNEKRLGPISR